MILLYSIVNLISFNIHAQDERIFKEEFIYKSPMIKVSKARSSFFQRGDIIKVNLNSDSLEEGLSFVKSNGEDFFELFDFKNKLIYKFKFDPVGINSKILKVKFKKLRFQNILVIYYYEGVVKGFSTKASARIYLVSFDKELKHFNMLKGPLFWKSFKDYRANYFEKEFKVLIKDSNNDGLKDIYIVNDHLHRVIMQLKNRKWINI